ncbi:MAG: tetraacyldisaccharide 4'-kinase [Candidatus Omnitrophica bacterium]|nr:tetraacyldisaccharide 4'-kinase [Candidatus Omnitrophota bacterium]
MLKDYLYNLATDKKKGILACFLKSILLPLSFFYGLVIKVLIFLSYLRQKYLNCKVISVGNITLGGTGKTSLVELIAYYLKNKGYRIAIISRGYKRRWSSPIISPAPFNKMGDEPYMLSQKLKDVKVIVDKDRIRAIKTAIKDYMVDVVILDDGLQQWRIGKDLEIVTINSLVPFGNRFLLPRGILRQPLSSLKDVDIFVLSYANFSTHKEQLKSFLRKINPFCLIVEAIHEVLGFYRLNEPERILNPLFFKDKPVVLFSGIGNPDAFEATVKATGVKVKLSFRFPDHYAYRSSDLEYILKEAKSNHIDTIITTEKDAVRFSGLELKDYKANIYVVLVRLKITQDEEGFFSRLLRIFNP